jgi:hypothetical protein
MLLEAKLKIGDKLEKIKIRPEKNKSSKVEITK